MYIMVYGTLKSGHGNNRLLNGRATLVTSATVRNFKLYDSGFPVAGRSDGETIVGEVWDIGDVAEGQGRDVLQSLDRLEGYRERDPDSSMYHRTLVVAHGADGNSYESGMYVGNPLFWREFRGMHECPKINDEYVWGLERLRNTTW